MSVIGSSIVRSIPDLEHRFVALPEYTSLSDALVDMEDFLLDGYGERAACERRQEMEEQLRLEEEQQKKRAFEEEERKKRELEEALKTRELEEKERMRREWEEEDRRRKREWEEALRALG